LEQTRENIEEIQEDRNWKELIEEDYRVVLQLFGLLPGQRYSAARQIGSKVPWIYRVSN
jgi:hypothetical protein